jgi:WD40 repeat protein/serine/threonine protein kinase
MKYSMNLPALLSCFLLTSNVDVDPVLAELIEEVTRGLQAGGSVDLESLGARDPARAEMIRRLMPSLRRLAELGPGELDARDGGAPADSDRRETGRRLGDFRLIRELGRGGMGIVFEAVQESLGRRVALKILPTAAALDPRALSRFQIETRAAACLQHTHIVPIHAVGEVEGIPYYAMQLIEGMSLARVIADMWQMVSTEAPDSPEGSVPSAVNPVVARLLSGQFDPSRDAVASGTSGAESMEARTPSGLPRVPEPGRPAGQVVLRWLRTPQYFRSVARVGVQAAEALEYAHAQGIVHRDIKPANLLLDPRGCLWVADFGLARLPADSGLTLTGELLGTLRYMSPEQASGKHALVDRRTDIYSLGATLYELLGLQPAFGGTNPPEILSRVAEGDAAPLRSLNPAVPPDLATIVAKAMAKDPSGRYVTAQHLADDLVRYLDGRPVAARPAPPWQKAMKWARRRPALTTLLVLVQVLAVALLALGGWSYRRVSLDAAAARARAEWESRARALSQRTSAELALERGFQLAEGRQVGRGLTWMLRSLELTPPEAGDLRRAALINLAEWGQRAPVPRVVRASGAPVSALTLSPDGRTIAVGADDGVLSLWDAVTGSPLGSARGPHAKFLSIEFHPDGRLLATTSTDNRAELWDVSPLRTRGAPLPFAADVAYPVAFHPDGRTILTAGSDGTVQLRSVETGRPVGTPLRTEDRTFDALRGVAFRPGGHQILTYGRVGGARLWDAASGRPLHGPLAQACDIVYVAFRADGRRIAMIEADAKYERIGIWDADSGQRVAESRLFTHGFHYLAYHPDGRVIATSRTGGAAHLFDAETGQTQGTPMMNAGHLVVDAFSPDGRLLVSGSFDGTVRFFDAATGRPLGAILEHAGPISGLLIRPDGRGVVTSSHDGAVRIWDISEIVRHGRAVPLAAGVVTAEFSPDGRLLATDGTDGAARVYETATGRPALPPLMHGARVRIARFSPDGRLLATGGDDCSVRLWDVATGRAVGPPMVQPAWALNARFSPDGRGLLVGTSGGVARLWDLETFRAIGPVLKHPVTAGHEIWNLAFDTGGRVAITGTTITAGAEATVGFWDAATGCPVAPVARFHQSIGQLLVRPKANSPLYVVEGGRVHAIDLESFQEAQAPFGQRIESIAFVPGAATVLAAGSDKTARLWDLVSGQPAGPILEHDDPVRGVAVSPDGATLLTLSGDRLRYWDAATGEPLGPPREHPGLTLQHRPDDRMPTMFSPDGRAAVTASGAVFFWNVPSPPRASGLEPARIAETARAFIDFNEQGDIAMLDKYRWRELLEGEGPTGSADVLGTADWHDGLAAEGERSGRIYSSRWHLDRLVAARPNDWAAYARRASARSRAGDGPGAAADWKLARDRTGRGAAALGSTRHIRPGRRGPGSRTLVRGPRTAPAPHRDGR